MKKQLQYKLNFILLCFAVTPIHLSQLFFSWVIVKKFDGFVGWSFWEMSLLYALLMVSYSVAQIFFRQFRRIDNFVVNGGLDMYFIQPVSIVYNLVFSQLNLMELFSQLLPSVIVLIITCVKLKITWSTPKILFLILAIVCATAIQSCIFCLIGFIAFWTMKSSFFHDLYSAFKDFLNYPLEIYNNFIRDILTCIIPMAFINYYPSLYLLDKKEAWSCMPILMVIVAVVLIVLTSCIAKRAYKNYASTGS